MDLHDKATLWAEKTFPNADPDEVAKFASEYQWYIEWARDRSGDQPVTPEQFYVASEWEL